MPAPRDANIGLGSLWHNSEEMQPYEKWIMKSVTHTGLDQEVTASRSPQTVADRPQRDACLRERPGENDNARKPSGKSRVFITPGRRRTLPCEIEQ